MDPHAFRFDADTHHIINVSGGRSSGYMLHRIVNAYDGHLPALFDDDAGVSPKGSGALLRLYRVPCVGCRTVSRRFRGKFSLF